LEPSVSRCNDFLWVGFPDEWFGLFGVVLRDEAVDGRLQVDDRAEHSMFEPASGELGEEA
jgi:hypothetical protein